MTTLRVHRHKLRNWLIAIGLLLVLAGGCACIFFRVGTWLVVEDPLEPSPVAVVLSGGMPERAREAAEIYRSGNAKQIWITHPEDVTEEMKQMGIYYLGETFYNQSVLLHLHVPVEKTRVLEPEIVNTQDEVNVISQAARDAGIHRVIIVTSKAHTRRVHAIWKKVVGADPALIVRYAPEDSFDPQHWWRHTADALQVVREVLGLANVWSGFLVKHRGS
ncbi:MAG TPA: YdcF family protein [Candidatus Acidoferrales bacterium]